MNNKIIAKNIKSSQKKVSVLFTDIEGSTSHWDKLGDVAGRLMVDQHNRLLFPVVKKFKGKVIKTIGDAIMAQFKSPQNALKAGIAIQQALLKERAENKKFNLRVRVGIHYGNAIVEHNDVYGDVVNVAARIEGKASGNEILISKDALNKIKKRDFNLTKKTKFVPKGKKTALQIYSCNWKKHESLIDNIKFQAILPVVRRQKIELFIYSVTCLCALLFFYIKYLRYFVGDFETAAIMLLNPINIWDQYPVITSVFIFLVLAGFFITFRRIKTVPIFTLRILKGSFYYCVVFFILFAVTYFYKPDFVKDWDKKLYSSKHLFVEVLAWDATIYNSPSERSEAIMNTKPGILLLLTDVAQKKKMKWNKILVRKGVFGWIPRVIPPKIGVPEKRVTRTYKYYFRKSDMYLLLVSFIGFFWGFLFFSLRPT